MPVERFSQRVDLRVGGALDAPQVGDEAVTLVAQEGAALVGGHLGLVGLRDRRGERRDDAGRLGRGGPAAEERELRGDVGGDGDEPVGLGLLGLGAVGQLVELGRSPPSDGGRRTWRSSRSMSPACARRTGSAGR